LGLGHPDEHGQIVVAQMNSRTSDLDHLEDDDIQGAQALYPPLVIVPPPVPMRPSFVLQPQGQIVTAGRDATFEVLASGNPLPTYEWYDNGVRLPGATGASLTLSNVQISDAGQIFVMAKNSVGSATSQKVILTVIPAPTRPSITSQPLSQAVHPGAKV